LVNGSPTRFFQSQRGLRQGCPLSPLLFILVMDGLSRMIGAAKLSGSLQGVKVSQTHHLNHILFVDDVLLFGGVTLEEWTCFHEITTIFCLATGMEISNTKSSFITVEGFVEPIILELFPIKVVQLDDGF